jgi:hypothetical protein
VIHPIIHDHLSQIFQRHYKLEPTTAAEESMRMLEVLELYGLQIIIGDWTIPEVVVVNGRNPVDAWSTAVHAMREAEGREPWLAKEIQ